MSARRPGEPTLTRATSCRRPRPWSPCWTSVYPPPSAGRTSWRWPWNAAATTGGEGRTRLRQLRLTGVDYAALVLAVALCVAIGVLGRFGW